MSDNILELEGLYVTSLVGPSRPDGLRRTRYQIMVNQRGWAYVQLSWEEARAVAAVVLAEEARVEGAVLDDFWHRQIAELQGILEASL